MNDQTRVHATAVALQNKAVLITGAAGSGKSSLALQLMAFGCALVSDDQTDLTRREQVLWASAPQTIRGLIEARGIGLLEAAPTEAPVVLAISLDHTETDRLPYVHTLEFLGVTLPCLHKVDTAAWPAAILQYLKGTRREPT